jgi:uncharacterized protein (TIGR02117 family)
MTIPPDSVAAQPHPDKPPRSFIWRWLRRTALLLAALLLVYVGFLLLGFVPVNLGYEPPPADDRVRIFVRSNEIHTDLVLPVVSPEIGSDWRRLFPPEHFKADVRGEKYLAVGWGNRRFFVETPRWADLKISAVFGALFWPSESVVHVEYLYDAAPGANMQEVYLTREQYKTLSQFVAASIGPADAQEHAVPATTATYNNFDRFYTSPGKYHLFNTCNQWTGRGLKRAGVPTGIWTPLKPHVLCWLPDSEP